MLLKPWRNIARDLKEEDQTWQEAFEMFLNDTPAYEFILSNIQYYHECQGAAREEHTADQETGIYMNTEETDDRFSDMAKDSDDEEEGEYTEEQLAKMIAEKCTQCEKLHAQLAVEAGRHAKLFTGDTVNWNVTQPDRISNATGAQLGQMEKWRDQMKNDVLALNNSLPEGMDNMPETDKARVGMLHMPRTMEPEVTNNVNETTLDNVAKTEALTSLTIQKLKADQRRAFDIIIWHIKQTLAGKKPPPLRMILYGEGGTGKSKVIQSVTAEMERIGAGDLQYC
jgi:hypothetical protein